MDAESIQGNALTFSINTHFSFPWDCVAHSSAARAEQRFWLWLLMVFKGKRRTQLSLLLGTADCRTAVYSSTRTKSLRDQKTLVCVSSTCRIILCDLSVPFTCWKHLGSNECCRDEHSSVCTGLRADWSMLKSYHIIEIHEGIFLKYFKTRNWHKILQSLGLH